MTNADGARRCHDGSRTSGWYVRTALQDYASDIGANAAGGCLQVANAFVYTHSQFWRP